MRDPWIVKGIDLLTGTVDFAAWRGEDLMGFTMTFLLWTLTGSHLEDRTAAKILKLLQPLGTTGSGEHRRRCWHLDNRLGERGGLPKRRFDL